MKLTDLKPGDVLIPDGGFTCLDEGCRVKVRGDAEGQLYVPCSNGRHYLDGQTDDNGEVVGLEILQ